MTTRHVTDEADIPRFSLYRLCHCPTCEGKGKAAFPSYTNGRRTHDMTARCPDCRGEGRIRQELATCATPEAVGVALVTLAREGEWTDCPLGLLDQFPECEKCDGTGKDQAARDLEQRTGYEGACVTCHGSGVKPTGTWLILPWLPSARNVSDAGRVLAKSKKPSATQ